jgi:release factor glutamine methyltransferase
MQVQCKKSGASVSSGKHVDILLLPSPNFAIYGNMLPTPSTSHVNFDNVYEPAEDSFLLIDTLSSASEAAFLSQRFSPNSSTPVLLEVGTGSGVVIAFLTSWVHKLFGRRDVLTLGIDINRFACQASAKTIQTAIVHTTESTQDEPSCGIFGDMVLSDLTSCIRPGQVDVLIFNPPYVPTEEVPELSESSYASDFERDSHLLALSYAGGAEGMETTDRLFEELPRILNPDRGVAYVLLCAQNHPKDVKARIRFWPGSWHAETVRDSGKKGGWEKLQIIRIWQSP